MNALGVLAKCLPFFALVGVGLNVLLSTFVPSWRENGWTHWKIYDQEANPNSWLVALGFVKPPKPIAAGDLSPKEAIWFRSCLGAFLVLAGLAGIVWIAYLAPLMN